MNAEFRRSFAKDLEAIASKDLMQRVQEIINLVEKVRSLKDIPNLKKLRDGGDCYRIRIGEYRVGLVIVGNRVTFVRCLHRREVYRHFP